MAATLERTDLQKRILIAAHGSGGRIILWIMGDGRWKIPAFEEDVAGEMKPLCVERLFARRDARGETVEDDAAAALPVGFQVFQLTAEGEAEARRILGR